MYKVTISDGTILSKCIQNVSFDIVTPDEYDMRNIVRKSMTISGTIDTEEKTVSLYQWALLKGNNPDCYREVTVEHYQKNVLLREVHFSKAFVIDYSEVYSNYEGVGTFSIYLRQFYKQDIDVTSNESENVSNEGAKGSAESDESENVQQTTVLNSTVPLGKKGTNVTDKLAERESPQNICEQGYSEIERYREQMGFSPYSDDSGDTVAMVEIEGQKFFGVNSSITKELQQETKELRQKWFEKVSWVPPKKNAPKHLGHVQSLTHAESHSLIVAFEKLGNTPKNVTMFVDRKTCNMCRGEMPALLKHMGIEELKIFCGGSTNPMVIKAVQ